VRSSPHTAVTLREKPLLIAALAPQHYFAARRFSSYRLAFVTPQWPVWGLDGLGCDNKGRSMDSKLNPAQADPHHDGDVVLLAPKDWTDAEEALSKVARVASDLHRPTARSDFSAGPRVTEPSLDPTLRSADVNNAPLLTDRPSVGRRTSRSLARFLVATCVGVAGTLAWQSYGGTAEQMIANSAPQLRWLLLSPSAPPSGREIAVEQPSPPAVQASVPQAASAQAGAVALTTSETSTAPIAPSPELQQFEADLAAVRQSVEQLAAGQEQMARDIAKLQTAGQDIRRRIAALPPTAATMARKPVPRAQPAPQSSAAPLPPAPPEPPSRPPMPVR
jgi:hypothetical protein